MWRRRHQLVRLRHEAGEVGYVVRHGIGLLSHGGQAGAGLEEEGGDEVRAGLCAQLSGWRCEYCEWKKLGRRCATHLGLVGHIVVALVAYPLHPAPQVLAPLQTQFGR